MVFDVCWVRLLRVLSVQSHQETEVERELRVKCEALDTEKVRCSAHSKRLLEQPAADD